MKLSMLNNRNGKLLAAVLLCMNTVTVAQLHAGVAPDIQSVQQSQGVKGQVVDSKGEAIIGATVKVKGTQSGSVTDFDGNFSINGVRRGTLVITYVGYVTKEVEFKSGESVKVTLVEDTKVVDEVVVIGYGVQKKSSTTGAISSVKAEDMENRTISSVQEALQGKTAGVQLISSGTGPGDTGSIRVRGVSSNASTEPLYVVDGVRLSNISGLDPNNIESMEVLKDGASAAIYGAEAGNGVILITTKKGKKGMGRLSYDFQFSSQSLAKHPNLMNAQEYITYMADEGGQIQRAAAEAYWAETGYADTDWIDATFENSKMMKHTLSFTGGNEQGNYYLSLGYLDNDGIIKGKNDYNKRLSGTINAEYKIKPWLTVGTTNNISKSNTRKVSTNTQQDNVLLSAMNLDPMTPVVFPNGTMSEFMSNALATGRTLWTDANGDYYGLSPYVEHGYNSVLQTETKQQYSSAFRVNGSAYANLNIVKGLVFTSRFGYALTGIRQSNVSLPYYANNLSKQDYVEMSSMNKTRIYYQWENFANYNTTIADAHNISAMLGMSFQETTEDYVTGSLTANGEDAILKNDPAFYYLSYASSSATKDVEGEKTRTNKLSYFGRIGYDYKGRYMAQATLRADAADTSILPADRRWGYFPSFSVGWAISEEPFFKPLADKISHLKIRASWGQNGSLASLSNYAYSNGIIYKYGYPFQGQVVTTTSNADSGPGGGPGDGPGAGADSGSTATVTTGTAVIPGAYPNSLGNHDLKWETSEQLNIGIDARFFKNRLTLGMDYFKKTTKDLLINGTTPSLTIGGTTSPINAGNVENKGFEFDLGWRDNIGKLKYGIKANLATLSNEVTYLDPSLQRIAGNGTGQYDITYFEKGYPIYYFRGFRYAGVESSTGNPQFYAKDGSITTNPTDDDLTYIGDALPDFTYGITLTADYKNFDLTIFGSGSYGNDIFYAVTSTDKKTVNRIKEVYYNDRWTASNPSGSRPRANATNEDKYAASSAMVYSGSYFKIKQIQLGYTFPKKMLNKLYISNLRVYGSLDDFFTFTSYPGLDPEVSANAVTGMGMDYGAYPASKKLVLGVNIEF